MAMRFLVAVWVGTFGCSAGSIVDGAGRDDREGAVAVWEGELLAAELAASPLHESAEAFRRVGLMWDADVPRSLELAASTDGLSWSEFAAPDVHHVEVEAGASFVGQIVLDREARFYRVRGVEGGGATFLRLELLRSTQEESVEDVESGPPSVIARSVGGVEVHERSAWGARSASCSSSLGTVTRMAIHHTESPTNDSLSPAARLRQIQSYHMDVRGWCDIGYHYLMSRDGRLWDGRPEARLGAHAGGANTGNLGISVMGSHDSTPISATQVESLASLIAALADRYGVAIDRSHIKGHRQYTSTTCPGDALYGQLGEIVDAAASGGGSSQVPGGGGGGGGAPWSCDGLTGTTTSPTGVYYTTSFGCWVDENGVSHSDAGDNCLPACSLSSIGCSGLSGPACERAINWYTADSDRFGCGTLLRVENPDNGRAAVLKVIDRGPNCSVEQQVDHWVLDMSYRASEYLFGGPTSATERADVRVTVVPAGTPLGPTTGGGGGGGGGGTVTVLGVLYAGSDTADRIAGAMVSLGTRTTTTSSSGLWQFTGVPEGSFTVTASATGYQTRSITRTTYAAETWASFGLSPGGASGTAILQGVIYHGGNSANRIAGATVTLSTGHTATASSSGFYKITGLPAGEVTISASASGFPSGSVVRTLVDGETEWGSVDLDP